MLFHINEEVSMKGFNSSRKASSGFVLTELLIGLAIIAAVLGTIAVTAAYLNSSNAAQDQARLIESIGKDLRMKYQRANNFSGLTTQVAINLGVFPDQMVNGTTALNTWNGTVAIAPAADLNSVANRAVLVTWPNVPADECVSLSTTAIDANRIRVGTTVIQQDGQAINVANAGTACTGTTNTVDFLFHKNG
jgi:type II secretory pathway pseudopilin PulG